ncbi:MAG: transglutaminase-like domain-containing protein, partial [Myxococcota bacterium]|nr:transglutaminase-like domain-containing protein [Myxococcota bacterium]
MVELPSPGQALDQDATVDLGSLGESWSGLYLHGRKVGYVVSRDSDFRLFEPSVIESRTSAVMEVDANGKSFRLKIQSLFQFDGRPPHRLRSFVRKAQNLRYLPEEPHWRKRYRIRSRGWRRVSTERVEMIPGPDPGSYEVSLVQGRSHRNTTIHVEYTLDDHWGLRGWLRTEPTIGEKREVRSFDHDELLVTSRACVLKDRGLADVRGVAQTVFVVHCVDGDGAESETRYLSDGEELASSKIGLGFERRAETSAVARKIGERWDIAREAEEFVLVGAVPAPKEITRLELEVGGELGRLLEDAPGQKVWAQPGTNRYRVVLTSGARTDVRVEEREQKQFLQEDRPFPSSSLVSDLAWEAVGDAETPAERVSRLVQFVGDYLFYIKTTAPKNVMEIIRDRTGSCSEHAALFVALARALSIPARTATGLAVGASREGAALGWHAWSEVALDGYWIPVDPTWGQTTISASHLRFPSDSQSSLSFLGRNS